MSMNVAAIDAPTSPPSFAKQIGELTSLMQLPRLLAAAPSLRAQPKGDGSPVMLLPGSRADSRSLVPRAPRLSRRGLGLGINPRCLDDHRPTARKIMERWIGLKQHVER